MSDWVIRLYLLYLALAFGLRTIVQWWRTGSTGIRGIALHGGAAAWLGGVLLVAAFVLSAQAPILDRRGVIGPIAGLDGRVGHAVGFTLYTIGLIGTLYAQFGMGASWRIGVDSRERTELVTGGLFAYVRNPIFTSMVATLLGLALLVANVVAISAVLVLFLGLELHVRGVEEPYLQRVHGDAYAAYAAGAGRFLPGIGKLQDRT